MTPYFKSLGSTSIVLKINLAVLFVIVVTIILALQRPSNNVFKTSANEVLEAEISNPNGEIETEKLVIEKEPEFFEGLDEKTRIGLVNLQVSDAQLSGIKGSLEVVDFEAVSNNITWKVLFPGYINEENMSKEQPRCPTIPIPDFLDYGEVDLVVAQLPCRWPDAGWNRDVFRLQVHMVAASLAVKKGKRNENGAVKLVLMSQCEPMREIFRCDDLKKKKDGTWWMYEVDAMRLEEKLRSPIGTCELILPLRDEGSYKEFDVTKLKAPLPHQRKQREAYVTVLHSSDAYICGAIALAFSIRKTGSTRDLVLLHDAFTNLDKLNALRAAGWSPRQMERIHNPHPRPDGLFEYNYSKFRILQLTDYDKIVFLDSDTIVLRNLDILFNFPSLSARSDHGYIFNSGLMVVEPSNCTFNTMMLNIKNIKSYNGGDQGFLNEIFVKWYRLPRIISFFKFVRPAQKVMADSMFKADPPQLYAIHYFGMKPWICYRDYDCNWDLESVRRFANDEAHWRWWRVYDGMDESMKKMCRLSTQQKNNLESFRREAEKMQYTDGHWKMNITDPRKDL